MTLWNRLFSSADRITPAPRTARSLRVETLEDRSVPAVLDLTTVGASGMLNDALFQQFNGRTVSHHKLDTFAELDGGGKQVQGYNTNANLWQFLETGNWNQTHAIKVKDLPSVTVNGVKYRELVLDVTQPRNSPLVSLDELKLYVSNSANLHNYQKGKLGGLTPVYDLDTGGDNWVKLTSKLNGSNTNGDMVVYVPDAVLSGGQYLSVYSKFGVNESAQCGEMSWSYGRCGAVGTPVAPPPVQSGSISGIVYQDLNIDGVYNEGDVPIEAGWLVWLDTNENGLFDSGEPSTTTDANGMYSFGGLAAGTYTVVADHGVYLTNPLYVTLTPGESVSGKDIGLIPARPS